MKNANTAFEYLGAGNKAYWRKKYGDALNYYNNALQTDPQNTEAMLCRALTLLNLKRYRQALNDLDKLISAAPDMSQAYVARGTVHEYFHTPLKALKDYEKAAELNPESQTAEKQISLLPINTVKKIVENTPEMELLEKILQKNTFLNDTLHSILHEMRRKSNAAKRPDCNLRCGGVCCHFTDDMWRHGVMVNPKNIVKLRNYLYEIGLKPEEHIQTISWHELSEEDRRHKSNPRRYMQWDGEEYVIHYPRKDTSRSPLQVEEYKKPRTTKLESIKWSQGIAHPCTFLSDRGCMIHGCTWEAGNGLEACRRFICHTGYIVNYLKIMGVALPNDIEEKDIEQVNNLAMAATQVLYSLFCDEGLSQVLNDKIQVLERIYAETDPEETKNLTETYLSLHSRQKQMMSEKSEAAEAIIDFSSF
ncbi:MAG: tetratricopeptide repeat protein [Candidatus Altiarchaeota archaeon]|nr:tetratricopeptide repeat protein [Candidatus Altiarchaeota archaeon]